MVGQGIGNYLYFVPLISIKINLDFVTIVIEVNFQVDKVFVINKVYFVVTLIDQQGMNFHLLVDNHFDVNSNTNHDFFVDNDIKLANLRIYENEGKLEI